MEIKKGVLFMKKKLQLLIYVILITSILVTTLSACQENGNKEDGDVDSEIINIELLDGESSYLNHPIAYPHIEESQITSISIQGPNNDFTLTRSEDYSDSFVFYIDGQDEVKTYAPPITDAEYTFDYESLYATVTDDGYGSISRVSYLCAALGAPYFDYRIHLPATDTEEGATKKAQLLEEYGLTKSECTKITFEYTESDGNNGIYAIIIGKQFSDGTGSYFYVDGRDYIYHTKMTYFAHAVGDFKSFVSGRVVPKGLDDDYIYEPYLTTDFKLWTNDELIVSFKFCNPSKRNGNNDLSYKNELSEEHLNTVSCESVLKLLGGITSDSDTSEGLIGETVELGLTPENMEKYNLFAHKIYFEMPRGIFLSSDGSGNDDLDDYEWISTLGVNLYFSPATYDENGNEIRYVGSDLFDIVVKVPAKDFEFLNYNFTEYWTRDFN